MQNVNTFFVDAILWMAMSVVYNMNTMWKKLISGHKYIFYIIFFFV